MYMENAWLVKNTICTILFYLETVYTRSVQNEREVKVYGALVSVVDDSYCLVGSQK